MSLFDYVFNLFNLPKVFSEKYYVVNIKDNDNTTWVDKNTGVSFGRLKS